MKYSVITFGCRVNQADSLGFEEDLIARGAIAAPSSEQADLVIINTCSVTASADQSARQTARRLARTNPKARIVVTGCYATRQPDEFRALPNVLKVIPNDEKPRLVSLLPDDLGLTTADRFGVGEGSCGAVIEPGIAGRTAFTLRVQTGCAQSCAYCIIPTTRGRPRSVGIGAVLAEVDRVAAAGFNEIALTGVHLGSYGRDLSPASSLIELLRALADSRALTERGVGLQACVVRQAHHALSWSSLDHARDDPELVEGSKGERGAEAPRPCDSSRAQSLGGAERSLLFRVSSLEPMDCTLEIVDLVATSDRFAPHFHLPLQHASNRVLTAMRRPYTIDYYAALVDRIRARLPHASLGSDVIVGFPGESDDDFEQLCSYLEQSPLTHLHVFPYSDRPGTGATSMTGKVHGAVTRARAARVREVGSRLTRKFRQSQVGTLHRGLTLEDGSLVVTGNYLKVTIPPGHRRNEWVTVRVTSATEAGMTGEIW